MIPFLRRSRARYLLCGLALLFTAGCESPQLDFLRKPKTTKYFTPTNFTGETRLPVGLHRVVLLPVFAGSIIPQETVIALEEVFSAELQKELRFEVVRLSRADCQRRFGASEYSSVGPLPHDFLVALGRDFSAEAVLFVDITAYRGYRPLTLGVRAKLATVEAVHLLWSFDEIFSADDPLVGNSVRHYYHAADPSGIPLDGSHAGLQSPSKFAAYVAAAMFNTIPPR